MSIQIPTEKLYQKIPMPVRGLLTATPGLFIDKRFSPNMANCRIYAGEVINRPGTTYLPTTPQTLDNIPIGGILQQTNGGSVYSVLGTKTKIYWYDDTPDTWTDVTGAAVFNGTDDQPWAMAIVHGSLIMSNGHNTDKCYEWFDPGTGNIAQLAASHGARYIVPFADRIVTAYTIEAATTTIDRVRWCGAGAAQHNVWNPVTDATAGFTDLIDTPGAITGMMPLYGRNFIFKRDYIHAMTETGLTSPSFGFQTVVDGIGCIEGRTIVPIGGGLFFLGREDIYIWDGGSRPQAIGTGIRDELFATLNRDKIRNAFAFHHELFNEYWLMVPTEASTWPDVAYVYNYIENAWSRSAFDSTCHSRYKVVDSSPVIDSISTLINDWVTPIDSAIGGADVVFPLVGHSDKQPRRINDNVISDADTGIAPLVTFDFPDSFFGPEAGQQLATVNRVIMTLRSRGLAAITVALSVDGGQTFTTLGTKTTPNDNATTRLYYPTRVTGLQGRIRLTTSDPFALQALTYELFMRSEAR